VNNQQLTGGGGNPDLDPYESTNFELSAEYYFTAHSMVSAEFFHRDISSYIVQKTEERALFNTDTGQLATYSVTSPVNAQNAKVSGLAIQGQTDIGAGFGIAANVTYADASIPNDEYYMPYLSELTYNVIPYYERGPLSVRLSYSYRDKYFTQIGRLTSKDYTDDYTQFDLSASFDLNPEISFYAKALNLLDETYYSFSSVTVAPTSFYKNGRQFMLGASFRTQ
jgi:iron complex outermembrane receptor protein